ncbi:MAG: 16S rRNA (uracil(1498)-N(3))-methyltransferase [Candidatus Aureabacteria bacterium]|nr:16S rRNA (uracil(1498)-N(3))-methyltransferase [Candidatus Auribacterota bacterium]
MHNRVYIESESLKTGRAYALSQDEAHHLIHVRRFKKGDKVEVIAHSGEIFQGVIKKDVFPVEIEIISKSERSFSGPVVHLFFGMTKYPAMETAVSKCAELGVSSFIPVICERSVLRKISQNRQNRLLKIAREALKQSRQKEAMAIDFSQRNLDDVLKNDVLKTCELKIAFFPSAPQRFSQVLMKRKAKKIALFIGPEGDFSPLEARLFEKHQIMTCSLGDTILRSDTAAIAASSAIRLFFD